MGQVQLLPVPKDSSALINYLQVNFRRVADALGLCPSVVDNRDIEITSSSRGIILTAANGNRYRITVGNTGTLTTTLL